MIRVFEIAEDKSLRINDHTHLVPELKALIDKYIDDPLPPLSYVYLMTVPDSPYTNMEQQEKEQTISEDVGGAFVLDDPLIHAAMAKLTKLYETPTARFYNSVKASMDQTSDLLGTVSLTADMDPKMLDIIDRMQMNAGKKIESFKKVEKERNEEFKIATRGKAKVGRY